MQYIRAVIRGSGGKCRAAHFGMGLLRLRRLTFVFLSAWRNVCFPRNELCPKGRGNADLTCQS